MSTTFKKIEAGLETVLIDNGFEKVSQEVSVWGATLLYMSESGLYFQISCDYRDRVITMQFGRRYYEESRPDVQFLVASYDDIVKACSDNFEQVPRPDNDSGWEEYSQKLITYLNTSLCVVIKRVTPAILDDLEGEGVKRRPQKFRFYLEGQTTNL